MCILLCKKQHYNHGSCTAPKKQTIQFVPKVQPMHTEMNVVEALAQPTSCILQMMSPQTGMTLLRLRVPLLTFSCETSKVSPNLGISLCCVLPIFSTYCKAEILYERLILPIQEFYSADILKHWRGSFFKGFTKIAR